MLNTNKYVSDHTFSPSIDWDNPLNWWPKSKWWPISWLTFWRCNICYPCCPLESSAQESRRLSNWQKSTIIESIWEGNGNSFHFKDKRFDLMDNLWCLYPIPILVWFCRDCFSLVSSRWILFPVNCCFWFWFCYFY